MLLLHESLPYLQRTLHRALDRCRCQADGIRKRLGFSPDKLLRNLLNLASCLLPTRACGYESLVEVNEELLLKARC